MFMHEIHEKIIDNEIWIIKSTRYDVSAQVKGNFQRLCPIQRPVMMTRRSPLTGVPHGQSPKHFARP